MAGGAPPSSSRRNMVLDTLDSTFGMIFFGSNHVLKKGGAV